MILAAAMMMTTQAADAQTEKKLTNFNDTTFTLKVDHHNITKQREGKPGSRLACSGAIANT